MKKIIACVVFLGLCFLLPSCSRSPQAANKQGTGRGHIPVVAVAALMKDMPAELTTFGTVVAYASVSIKAEVDGILTKVHFRKGQDVSAGDLLFTIDPRQYKAALDQAKANLARDKAEEANARRDAERATELVKKGFIAQSDYDKSLTSAEALSASVQADEAAVASAQLQVERCSIRSPISGKTGNLLIDEGTLIKANEATLVTINQMRPIEVFFSVPQAELPSVRRYMAQGEVRVRAALPKDTESPEEGKLIFVDNAVDKTTGTAQLAASFKNSRGRLWPGQYVIVTLLLAVQKDALVVPASAVQTGREGKYVYVVKPDKSVEVRPVTVRATTGGEVVIEAGLRAGELVVTDGQLRLSPGAMVEIKAETKSPSIRGGRSS